ncbi:hypothetical protein NMY22_g5121 [Coprinellus aureogranulatus]|nr:hypothetical protein NMY22_g5121 [Coprinellus aureogranulatus]
MRSRPNALDRAHPHSPHSLAPHLNHLLSPQLELPLPLPALHRLQRARWYEACNALRPRPCRPLTRRDLTPKASPHVEHKRYEERNIKISDPHNVAVDEDRDGGRLGVGAGKHAKVDERGSRYRGRAPIRPQDELHAPMGEFDDVLAYRNEDDDARLEPRTSSTNKRRWIGPYKPSLELVTLLGRDELSIKQRFALRGLGGHEKEAEGATRGGIYRNAARVWIAPAYEADESRYRPSFESLWTNGLRLHIGLLWVCLDGTRGETEATRECAETRNTQPLDSSNAPLTHTTPPTLQAREFGRDVKLLGNFDLVGMPPYPPTKGVPQIEIHGVWLRPQAPTSTSMPTPAPTVSDYQGDDTSKDQSMTRDTELTLERIPTAIGSQFGGLPRAFLNPRSLSSLRLYIFKRTRVWWSSREIVIKIHQWEEEALKVNGTHAFASGSRHRSTGESISSYDPSRGYPYESSSPLHLGRRGFSHSRPGWSSTTFSPHFLSGNPPLNYTRLPLPTSPWPYQPPYASPRGYAQGSHSYPREIPTFQPRPEACVASAREDRPVRRRRRQAPAPHLFSHARAFEIKNMNTRICYHGSSA